MNDPLNQHGTGGEIEKTEILGYPAEFIWKDRDNTDGMAAFTYGWKVTVNGQEYGDFIAVTEKELLPEAKEVLLEQAEESLRLVLAG